MPRSVAVTLETNPLFHMLWRHKHITLAVLIITIAGVAAVLLLTPDVYRTTSSVLVVSPPSEPSAQQLEDDPDLADIDPSNPFLRSGSSGGPYSGNYIVMELVGQRLSHPARASQLVEPGARFELSPVTNYNSVSPFLEVQADGPTARVAQQTAEDVITAIESELGDLQAEEGVDPFYMYRAFRTSAGPVAELQSTGKVRAAVAVVAAGMVLLFLMLTIAAAFQESRAGVQRGRLSRRHSRHGRKQAHASRSATTSQREEAASLADASAGPGVKHVDASSAEGSSQDNERVARLIGVDLR